MSSCFEHRSDPNRLLLCVEETCRGTMEEGLAGTKVLLLEAA